MKALTPKEKADKKQRDNLKALHNRLLAAFSLKQITTWYDTYKFLGLPDETIKSQHSNYASPVTYKELQLYLDQEKKHLEERLSPTSIDTPLQTSEVASVAEKILEDGQGVNNEVIPVNESTAQASNSASKPPSVGSEEKISSRETQTLLIPEDKREEKLDARNDYGLTPSPKEKAFLFWHQKKAAAELCRKVIDEHKSGVLLLAPTGVGKTFDAAALLRRLLDCNYHEGKTYSHIPYLYITKSTIIEQTVRVFENKFNIQANVDVEVINIEQLRAKAGQLWVQEKVKIVGGNEISYWEWRKRINPCVVLVDESQGTKNKKAKQSQIINAYNNLQDSNTCLISISATPFMRVCEAQSFAVSTHRPLDHLPGFPKGAVLINENWLIYSSIIAAPSKPDEFNQAAVARLMDDLEPWIVRVRGVKPQFDAVNKVEVTQFETDEKRKFYLDAYERFLRDKAKIDAAVNAGDNAGVCYLVILLKFAMAAELCHAEGFADRMYKAWQEGKAPVAAVKFKGTLTAMVEIFIEKYHISRDNISLIWGGGQTQLTKKQKAKAKIKSLKEKFESMGIEMDEMIEDVGLDEVEDRVIKEFPPEYRLGPQSKKERQNEIDKFQSGRAKFAIYTLKAGGVGLSLHHTDEFTKFKCRRKESGYVYEEDIANVPIRPRETFVTVTFNAVELVQGVGRVPRLTSLSPTIQHICCYAGTVEAHMAEVYSKKLRCLSAVVKQKESWQQIILGAQRVEDVLATTADVADDESSLIDEGDSFEDEEDSND